MLLSSDLISVATAPTFNLFGGTKADDKKDTSPAPQTFSLGQKDAPKAGDALCTPAFPCHSFPKFTDAQ